MERRITMKFTVVRNDSSSFRNNLIESLVDGCLNNGDELINSSENSNYALNLLCKKSRAWVNVLINI